MKLTYLLGASVLLLTTSAFAQTVVVESAARPVNIVVMPRTAAPALVPVATGVIDTWNPGFRAPLREQVTYYQIVR